MTETGRRLSAEAVMGVVIAARTCVEGASVKAQHELNGDVPLPGASEARIWHEGRG